MARTWLLRLLVVAAIWLALSRLADAERLLAVLLTARWQYLALAVLLQALYHTAFTGLYRTCFLAMGVRRPLRELLPVNFAALFLNLVAPGSATALWVHDASLHGQSGARAAAGTVLVRAIDFGSFALVLVVGLVLLSSHHVLKSYEVAAAGMLMLLVIGWTGLLVLGLGWPAALQALLGLAQRAANAAARLVRRPAPLTADWSAGIVAELGAAADTVRRRPSLLLLPALLGLLCQGLDLASLAALFAAFGQPLQPAVVVAGFTVGLLFWIVAITPQGVGVVEGVMPLALVSLGVPAAKALSITLAFRGLGFWLPLLAGFALVRSVPSLRPTAAAAPGVGDGRTAAAGAAALLGIVNLLSAVTPSLAWRLEIVRRLWSAELRQGSHLVAALCGYALLLLAPGLARGKQAAWFATLTVLIVAVGSNLVKGLDYEEASLSLLLALWLLLLRARFHVLSDAPSARQGFLVLAAGMAFTLAYGVCGLYLLDRHFHVDFGLLAAAQQTVHMFTRFPDTGLEPVKPFGRYFGRSIYLVAAATTGYSLLLLLRPVLLRKPATRRERRQARAIVENHGRSSLAWFTLLPDKHYYLTEGGSVLAYAAHGRVATVLGDPIGPEDDFGAAVSEFSRYCLRQDWRPAYVQVLPDHLAEYRAAGMQALMMGHEAIIDLHEFSLEGQRRRGLRRAVNNLEGEGHYAAVEQPPLPGRLVRQLHAVSDAWLTKMHSSEKRFSLGWFDPTWIREQQVAVVYDAAARPQAFANLIPEYRRKEATIDLMRYRPGAQRRLMEFLFVRMLQWAQAEGYDTFNLGLSPLAGVGEQVGAPAVERVLHYVYRNVSRFYDFQGLHDFKAQFLPEWSPRYLIYPNAATLPAVWFALLRAQSPGGTLRSYLH